MSLSEINTRLQNIESKISTLSGMMHSSMITSANDNRRFETYLRMIAKKQLQMQQAIELILANLEIRNAWDNEEDLDEFFDNFNKEFN